MGGLCRYSGALGEPGKGAHAARVGGLAAADLLGAAALAWVGMRLAGGRSVPAFAAAFAVVMLAAIAAHEAFCVNTRLNAALFGRPWPGPYPNGVGAPRGPPG